MTVVLTWSLTLAAPFLVGIAAYGLGTIADAHCNQPPTPPKEHTPS